MPRVPDRAPVDQVDVAYLRVSSDEQRDKKTIDTQRLEMHRYLEYAGLDGALWLEDDGVSGALPFEERPQGAELQRLIAEGRVRTVVVVKIDRLGRSALQVLKIVDQMKRAGVRFVSIKEQIDLGTPIGQFFLGMLASFAEMERALIKERTVGGKHTRAAKGLIHRSGTELYGYTRDKENGVRLVNAVEAAVVHDVFAWVAEERLPIRAVIRRLNGDEPGRAATPAPSAGKRTFKDGRTPRWGKGAVQRILREPTYKGEGYGWRWTGDGNGHRRLRPRSEWLTLAEGSTPAIVDPETWQAVEERLDANEGADGKNAARPYLLRGLVECAVCGRKMRASPERGRRTYRCSSRETPSGPCGGARVPADALEGWAWPLVAAALRDPEVIAEQVRQRREALPSSQDAADLDTARSTLARLERQQERLMRRYREADEADEETDRALFRLLEREVARCEAEREQAAAAVATLGARLEQEREAIDELAELHDYCARVRGRLGGAGFDRQRQAFEAVSARIVAAGADPEAWRIHGSIPIAGTATQSSAGSGHGACIRFVLPRRDDDRALAAD